MHRAPKDINTTNTIVAAAHAVVLPRRVNDYLQRGRKEFVCDHSVY